MFQILKILYSKFEQIKKKMASAITTINGHLEIIAKIGEGAQSKVFKVLDKEDDQM